jgi:hypothetical protein
MARSSWWTRWQSFSHTCLAAATLRVDKSRNFSTRKVVTMADQNVFKDNRLVPTPEAPSPVSMTTSSINAGDNVVTTGAIGVLNADSISGLEEAILSGVPQNKFEFWYLVSRNWANILFCETQCSGGSPSNERMGYLLGLKKNQDPKMADELSKLYEQAAAMAGSSTWPGFDHLKGLAENGVAAVQMEGEENALTRTFKHYAERYGVSVPPTTVEKLYGKTGREGEEPTHDERVGGGGASADPDSVRGGQDDSSQQQGASTDARLDTPRKPGDAPQ